MKFKCVKDIKMSPMESLLHRELSVRSIPFHQEVTFYKCKNPKTGHLLRYDFYIPTKNLLIEYDGKDYHVDEEVLYRDGVKTKFAKDNKIRLVRLSGMKQVNMFLSAIESYKIILKKEPKPKSRKEKIKRLKKEYKESQKELSPTEIYHAGLQPHIKTNEEVRSLKALRKKKKKQADIPKGHPGEINMRKRKEVLKQSTWIPVPYKRIIIM